MTQQSRLLGLAAVMTLAACGTKDAAAPLTSGPAGRIRFVNLITDPTRDTVNAILEGLPLGVALRYSNVAPATLPAPATALYAAVLEGSRTLVLKKTADTATTIGTYSLTITADQDVTVYGTGTGATSVTTTDVNPAPVATEVRFRVANMSSLGSLDAFFTASGADLTTATPNATNVAAQTASAYFTLAPGTYQVRFVPAGTPAASRNASVVLTLAATAFTGGTARTILAANAPAPTNQRAIVLSDR